jgi:hypothetical protein
MSAVDDARAAGRALAADAGPVTDPGVIARVATVVHAATCMSNATNGRATDNAPAVHDKQEIAAPDVYE